jgi:hypothetical protein
MDLIIEDMMAKLQKSETFGGRRPGDAHHGGHRRR